jgi:hypothetical protein
MKGKEMRKVVALIAVVISLAIVAGGSSTDAFGKQAVANVVCGNCDGGQAPVCSWLMIGYTYTDRYGQTYLCTWDLYWNVNWYPI